MLEERGPYVYFDLSYLDRRRNRGLTFAIYRVILLDQDFPAGHECESDSICPWITPTSSLACSAMSTHPSSRSKALSHLPDETIRFDAPHLGRPSNSRGVLLLPRPTSRSGSVAVLVLLAEAGARVMARMAGV